MHEQHAATKAIASTRHSNDQRVYNSPAAGFRPAYARTILPPTFFQIIGNPNYLKTC
jgi:hypothetical protein